MNKSVNLLFIKTKKLNNTLVDSERVKSREGFANIVLLDLVQTEKNIQIINRRHTSIDRVKSEKVKDGSQPGKTERKTSNSGAPTKSRASKGVESTLKIKMS